MKLTIKKARPLPITYRPTLTGDSQELYRSDDVVRFAPGINNRRPARKYAKHSLLVPPTRRLRLFPHDGLTRATLPVAVCEIKYWRRSAKNFSSHNAVPAVVMHVVVVYCEAIAVVVRVKPIPHIVMHMVSTPVAPLMSVGIVSKVLKEQRR